MRQKAKDWRWLATTRSTPLLSATYLERQFSRHVHNHYVVGVVERGACRSWYDGSFWTVPEGSLVILPPGEVHDGVPLDGVTWVWRALYPSIDLIDEVWCEGEGGNNRPTQPLVFRNESLPDFPGLVRRDADLARAFLAIHAGASRGGDDLEIEGQLIDLLGAIFTRHGANSAQLSHPRQESRRVRQVKGLIHDRIQEGIGIPEMARSVGLSSYHFLRIFSKEVGMTPHAYLCHVRVARAKDLIIDGFPLVDVAAMVGFSDQSHLTREFRRVEGITPGEFRRSLR